MRTFEEWFDMMQDIGEHCGTSLGQWHMELMESAWDASHEELKAENESLRKALIEVREALGREYWDQYAGLDETRDILDAAISSPENN
jgi:hypothetical protein